ncbi:hypothetical protein MPSEU_000953100 [Mayamaea pseudoterrestris]|nr:hypothetical protein MPSEU_000953100 [Mayamaea pseudoterrestris]
MATHHFAASATDLTLDALQQELLDAEQALQENERKRKALSNASDDAAAVVEEPLPSRLGRLEATANDLLLAQHIAEWKKQYQEENDESLVDQVCQLEQLTDILVNVNYVSETYERLVEDDFLPYCEYLFDELKYTLRNLLQHANYPSPEGCRGLLEHKGLEKSDYQDLIKTCGAILRLVNVHERVVRHVGIDDALLDADVILREFCRPFVERIDFHFVQQQQQKPTTNRIDRLPEWVCSYIKEHVFDGGPWQLVENISASLLEHGAHSLPLDFCNEMVRLVQWVLGERNFFRHAVIAGPDSKPNHLMNAIEQFIRFDGYLQSIVNHPKERLLKLMDVFVRGDDELLSWWLQREREYVFATLFSEQRATALVSRVSPRAELFCSIIRSIQCKAAVFSFSGPYLSNVAAPLCMQFVDAVDETSTTLLAQLGGRDVPTDKAFAANINEWIELINGTHMAALILCVYDDESETAISGGDQDLARFGRSLQHLEGVLVDEFANILVDTILMERARFAGYLVRCSHMLSCEETEVVESFSVTSPELLETRRLLVTFFAICDASTNDDENDEIDAVERSKYAPRLLKDRVLTLMVGKILEVALNLDEMTPDLHPAGCSVFASDIQSLFGSLSVPPFVLRLLNVTKIMAMPFIPLSQLGDALCGLVGIAAPLELEYFTADERLYEEAMSMLDAKGMVWLELADILNVLNRRRDLRPKLNY